jgi:hypothetical protein
MAKKKKKEKEKDPISEYSLDSTLKSSKKTKTDLKGLLRGFSEEKGFGTPKEEEKIKPQLSYESKKKIAEDYIMEDIPLTEREKIKEEKTKVESVEEKVVEEKKDEDISSKPISTKEKPSFSKKDDIYFKLSKFFEELFTGYNKRYDRWENSVSALLAILRKMRKITKKNTEDLVSTINNLHEKIQKNLEQFKIKRDEIEKVSDVDVESMSSEFKKVLGLLELQVKEYQLKRLTDEYIHQNRT